MESAKQKDQDEIKGTLGAGPCSRRAGPLFLIGCLTLFSG